MGRGAARKVETAIGFASPTKDAARPRSGGPSGAERAAAARESAARKAEELRAGRAADAEAVRESKRKATLAKAKAAAFVVEDHTAIVRQQRIDANRQSFVSKVKKKKKYKLKEQTQEGRIAIIKIEIAAAEDVARACHANTIYFWYRVYRRRRKRQLRQASTSLQRIWRGAKVRAHLRDNLAAQTLQVAWRAYAARVAQVRGECLIMAVVKLQRMYFREKSRRCEILWKLAHEAKEAAFVRRARMKAGAAAAKRQRDAAEVLRRAEWAAGFQERVRQARIRRKAVAKRRRVVHEAVHLIKAFRAEQERERLRRTAYERMERTLRKRIRMKMLRRLAATSFVSERYGRITKELEACTATIRGVLRTAEVETSGDGGGGGGGRRTPEGAGTRGRGRRQERPSTAADAWDWGEGDDIIRSLHLRTALTPLAASSLGGAASAFASSGAKAQDPKAERVAVAEQLGKLPTPRQQAVVSLVVATHPECCVDVGPPGEQQLTVDLGKVSDETLREIRGVLGAESAASIWQRGGSSMPRASTAGSSVRGNMLSGKRMQKNAKEKMQRRKVADGAAALRRTMRRELSTLGGGHHMGLNVGLTNGGGGGGRGGARPIQSEGGARPSRSQRQQRIRERRGGSSRPATVDQLQLLDESEEPFDREEVDDRLNMRLDQSPLRGSPPAVSYPYETGYESALSTYNRRLSPILMQHDAQLAAAESKVHDDLEWRVRRMQSQGDIILNQAASPKPISREVQRRATELGMLPRGALRGLDEKFFSPPAYREERARARRDDKLLGKIALSRAMDAEVERVVRGKTGDTFRDYMVPETTGLV